MTTNVGASSAYTSWERTSSASHGGTPESERMPQTADPGVIQNRLSHEQREAAIKRAGDSMEIAYAAFARTGKAEDLDRAYRFLELMRELVKGRTNNQGEQL